MRLERLTLTDFRNYARCVWEPAASISVLTGENGSGKTNLLEAISLLAPGRGLRSSPPNQLPRLGTSQWGIASRLQSRLESFELATGNPALGGGKRVFHLDRQVVRSQAHIAARFSCVWLTPQMDRLFGESASGRRRFLDRLVMGVDPDHARQMTAHERSVQSRNRILGDWGVQGNQAWLDSVEHSISRHAVAATAARMSYVERMNAAPFATQAFPLSLMQLDCAIAAQLATRPALEVEDWLRDQLRESRVSDHQKGLTSLGVHRADLHLSDAATGRQAALSSSGQQKVMMLGVMLAHAQLVADTNGEPPVILLDEPLVHLDEFHRHALLDSLKGLETTTLLTGTDAGDFSALAGQAEFLHVREGALRPEGTGQGV